MRMQRRTRWQAIAVIMLLLVVAVAVTVHAYDPFRPVANSTVTTMSPAAATPSLFWQTATARVTAALNPVPTLMPEPFPVSTFIHSMGRAGPINPDTPATTNAAAPAPSGSQLLNRTLDSPSLRRQMPYFIYLPARYAESGKRYPVIYMLHGYGGSNTEWISYGFPEIADHMMNAGEIPPTIIVFPQGDQSYWVNHADGERWGDYTAHDVVQYIDATYRTIPDAAHRAIGGLSMGGVGALQLALNYPGIFSVVGMNSPTLRDYASALPYFGDEAFFNAHDPIHLVQQYPDRARQLKISLDVGEQDDQWHDIVVGFHNELLQLNIPHDWHKWPGVHDGAYWGAHCADDLRFYAAALAQS